MECPIGLICEYFECRPSLCADYAAPVPLPFIFWELDGWGYPKGTLICDLPQYQEDEYEPDEPEHMIIARDNYNAQVERIRRFMIEGGWHGYCDLPYKYDAKSQALVVVWEHLLRGDDLEFDKEGKIDFLNYEDRGFLTALPLDDPFIPKPERYQWDIQKDGFCYNYLIWSRHLYEDLMEV